MQSYASSLAMIRVSPPSIAWSHDRSKVSYKGSEVVLDHLRRGLRDMERDVTQKMDKVMLNKDILYQIPPKLTDDMTKFTNYSVRIHILCFVPLSSAHITSRRLRPPTFSNGRITRWLLLALI